MNFDRIEQMLKQQAQTKPVLEEPTAIAQAMYETLKKQAKEQWAATTSDGAAPSHGQPLIVTSIESEYLGPPNGPLAPKRRGRPPKVK